jgi:hypothetical protein
MEVPGRPEVPGQRPGPHEPTEPGGVETAGRNSLWLAIAGLALTLLASLWGALAGLVLSAAALVTGLRARRHARQRRTAAPGADVGIAVGAIGLVFALFVTGMTVLLYTEMTAYTRCASIANTHSDRDRCQQQFLRGVERKFGRPVGELENHPLFS